MSYPYGNCQDSIFPHFLEETEDSIFPHFMEETEFDLNENGLLSECCLNRDFIITLKSF